MPNLPEAPLQSSIVPARVPDAFAQDFRDVDTDESFLMFLLTGISFSFIRVQSAAVTSHNYPVGRDSSLEPSRLRADLIVDGKLV